MRYCKWFLIVCFVPIASNALFGKNEAKTQDSLQIENQGELTILLLQKADSAKISDSIQKEVLRIKLEELKSSEISKRRKLEAELNAINEKDSLKRLALKIELDSIKENAKGVAVCPHNDTLFYFYTRIGNITPFERAKIVTARLKELYAVYFVGSDSLVLSDYGQSVDIVFKDKTLVSISELDAMWFGVPKLEIATSIKSKIEKDIVQYKADVDIMVLVREIALTVLVVFCLGILIYGTNRLFNRKIKTVIWKKKDVWFSGISMKDTVVIKPEQQALGLIYILNLVRYLLIIVQVYITLPLLFSIYPPTQRLAETLYGYLLEPISHIYHSFLNYLPQLFTVLVIVVIVRYILKFLHYVMQEIENEKIHIPGFYPDWAKPTYSILRFLIYAFMFVAIFPYLPGSDSPVFKGMSVFLGVMFSLGSSSIMGNMVSGIVITYMRPFVIGDRIKIGDLVGDVVEKTAFVTRIKTPKKEFVTIPNSNVLNAHVINYSTSKHQDGGIILHTTITIGYDVPWKKVHELLITAANNTTFIMDDPAPFVLQTSLDDFYVSYQLNAHTYDAHRQPIVYSHLHQNIQDTFNEAGVEIMSPHYRGVRDGNETTMPSIYRPEGYVAPSFKVKKED